MTDRGDRAHLPGVRDRLSSSAPDPSITLEALYRAHAGFVWRVVQRFGVPLEAAQDAVQEVFIIARRRLPDYEGRGEPTSWLYGIARGVCANLRRSRQRTKRRLAALPDPLPAASMDERLEREQASRLVAQFVDQLPAEQRVVFELSDIEGMSGPDIARALRVKVNQVYSRQRLARRRFHAFLVDRGLVDPAEGT